MTVRGLLSADTAQPQGPGVLGQVGVWGFLDLAAPGGLQHCWLGTGLCGSVSGEASRQRVLIVQSDLLRGAPDVKWAWPQLPCSASVAFVGRTLSAAYSCPLPGRLPPVPIFACGPWIAVGPIFLSLHLPPGSQELLATQEEGLARPELSMALSVSSPLRSGHLKGSHTFHRGAGRLSARPPGSGAQDGPGAHLTGTENCRWLCLPRRSSPIEGDTQ